MKAEDFYKTMWNPIYVGTDHKQFSYNEMIEFATEYADKYLESELSNIGRSKVDSAVTGVNGDYTNVSHRTDHGDTEKTAVESALASTPETKEVCQCKSGYWEGYKNCVIHGK